MRKIMSIMIIMIMMMIPVMPEVSSGVTGHVAGCPNAGSYDLSCCTRTFNISAKEGYEVTDVIVNGVNQGAISSYTFANIVGQQTLEVITRKMVSMISYNANGGSGAPESQEKIHGVNLTLSSTIPTRGGYNFTGWNTAANGSGTAYASGGTYTGNVATTLYAQWTLKTYTVSYNANGGSGAPGNQTKTHGTGLTLSSTIPTRSGYDFIGWNTAANGSEASYSVGGSYTGNVALTLYAQWAIKVGTYIAYTPSSTSYTVPTTASGHTSAQTYNPSTYSGGWKVFKNNNGQLDIVSAESIGNLTLGGEAGYAKAVKTLNDLCSAYRNPTYADSGRSLGYGGAVGEINTTTYPLNHGVGGWPYLDSTFCSDANIIDTNTGLRHSSGRVWIASRFPYYVSNTYFNVRFLRSDGIVDLYSLGSTQSTGIDSPSSRICGVRPVVSLKSEARISGGSGTQADPYRITI